MKIGGRKLSHAQLEAIRCGAGGSSAGWTAANGGGACALVFTPARVFVWLAAYRAGGWDALLRARKASGRPEAVDGVSVEMDLQYRDIEKSASAAISLCALDESDDRHAGFGATIRHQAQCDLGGSIVGANGVELPKAAEPGVRAGFATLVKQNGSSGISPRSAPWRKKRSVLSCFLPG